VVDAQPGLYFVGLFFLSSVGSSLVGGVGRDAARIAARIVVRVPAEEGLPAAR
jgi:putative flavoprotein involved in K+ transport